MMCNWSARMTALGQKWDEAEYTELSRVRIFAFTERQLLRMQHEAGEAVLRLRQSLPERWELVGIAHDFAGRAALLKVWSPEYPVVREDNLIAVEPIAYEDLHYGPCHEDCLELYRACRAMKGWDGIRICAGGKEETVILAPTVQALRQALRGKPAIKELPLSCVQIAMHPATLDKLRAECDLRMETAWTEAEGPPVGDYFDGHAIVTDQTLAEGAFAFKFGFQKQLRSAQEALLAAGHDLTILETPAEPKPILPPITAEVLEMIYSRCAPDRAESPALHYEWADLSTIPQDDVLPQRTPPAEESKPIRFREFL